MATDKNITMKQYNGADYDTLYPKTTTAQVDGLSANFYNKTESDSRYVNMTGDTMTGVLNINTGTIGGVQSYLGNRYIYMQQETDGSVLGNWLNSSDYCSLKLKNSKDINNRLQFITDSYICNILHTGNLSTYLNGYAKIQTGSYVGTGTYGASNPCSLTFNFEPKMVAICSSNGGYFSIPFLHNSPRFCVSKVILGYDNNMIQYGNSCSWSGNTITWYVGESEEGQLNKQALTYYYLAIG